MLRTAFVSLAFLLVGCSADLSKEHEEMFDNIREARKHVKERRGTREDVPKTVFYKRALAIADSVIGNPPTPRSKEDSSQLASMYLVALNYTYHVQGDTLGATFLYLEAMAWLASEPISVRVDQLRMYAETIGDAVNATHSPNMARLSYQAFERAKRLALDHGDPHYIDLADSSYKTVARQVLTMPDSVRAAFGPPPDRPARIPWVLATLAAAFIAASVAGGWGWNGNTQAPRFARPLSQKKRR